MVDLVLVASVVEEPCHKVALWVLEENAGNHKAVRRREIYQAVTISTPRANCKLAQDMPCCHVHGTESCVPSLLVAIVKSIGLPVVRDSTLPNTPIVA